MKKNILLLDTGGSNINFVYKMISSPDLRVFIAAPKKHDWMSEWAQPTDIIECDVYEYDSLLNAVQKLITERSIKFDGIGTYYDSFVTQMAKLSNEFETCNISIDAANQSSADKFKMRQSCEKANIQMPKYSILRNAKPDSLLKAINESGTPCVVKPIMGWKSFGVKKFENVATLEDVEEIFKLTSPDQADYFKNFSHDFLIEEYLSGPLLSVDGFVQDGKISVAGMIEFILGPEPHFTVEKNYIPARLDTNKTQDCIQYTKNIIGALDFNNCGFHCELRLTKNGPRLIEIACRLPGGPLQMGYQKAYGYNLPNNLIDIWTGTKTSLEKTTESFIAQKAIFHHQNGILDNIIGIDEISNLPEVWASAQITNVGDRILTYPDAPEPIYFYATEAKSPKELAENEKKVEALVSYKVH